MARCPQEGLACDNRGRLCLGLERGERGLPCALLFLPRTQWNHMRRGRYGGSGHAVELRTAWRYWVYFIALLAPPPTTHPPFIFRSTKSEVTFSNTWNSFSTVNLEDAVLQAPGRAPGTEWDTRVRDTRVYVSRQDSRGMLGAPLGTWPGGWAGGPWTCCCLRCSLKGGGREKQLWVKRTEPRRTDMRRGNCLRPHQLMSHAEH